MKSMIFILLFCLLAIQSSAIDAPGEYPKHVTEIVSQADSAIADGRWADADKLLVEAIELSPGNPANVLLLSNIGVVRRLMGDEAGALDALNEANAIAPASVTVLNNRAKVYLSMGEKDKAVADYEKVMQLDSTLSDPYFYRGMVRFSRGDIAGASDDFYRLRELSPGSENSLLAMATLHTATGHNDEALAEYRELIKISPDAEYYSGLIENRLALDQLTEAAEDIAEAMKRYPVNPEFYLFRAILNKRRYLYDDARADARRAVSLGADAKMVNSILNSR